MNAFTKIVLAFALLAALIPCSAAEEPAEQECARFETCPQEPGRGAIVLEYGEGITQALERSEFSMDCLFPVVAAGGIQESAIRALRPGDKLCVPAVCQEDPLPRCIVKRSRAIMRRDMAQQRTGTQTGIAVPGVIPEESFWAKVAALEARSEIAGLRYELATAKAERDAWKGKTEQLKSERGDAERLVGYFQDEAAAAQEALTAKEMQRLRDLSAAGAFCLLIGIAAAMRYYRGRVRDVRKGYEAEMRLLREIHGEDLARKEDALCAAMTALEESRRENIGPRRFVVWGTEDGDEHKKPYPFLVVAYTTVQKSSPDGPRDQSVFLCECPVKGCRAEDLQVDSATLSTMNLLRHLIRAHLVRPGTTEQPLIRLVPQQEETA